MFLNAFGYLMLGTQSCRGSIWDKNEDDSRKYVFYLLHIVIILGTIEFLMVLIAIVMVVTSKEHPTFDVEPEAILRCATNECNSAVERWTTIADLLIVLACFLAINGLYKIFKYSKFFFRMGTGCHHLMKRLCFCCKGTFEMMDETGELVDQFFPAKSIVPTDVFAGLTYLHARAKHNRKRMSSGISGKLINKK